NDVGRKGDLALENRKIVHQREYGEYPKTDKNVLLHVIISRRKYGVGSEIRNWTNPASHPKSEDSDWTQLTMKSNLNFRISDMRCRIRPISDFRFTTRLTA